MNPAINPVSRLLSAVMLLVAISLPTSAAKGTGQRPSGPQYAPDRIIVKFAETPPVSARINGAAAKAPTGLGRLNAEIKAKEIRPLFRGPAACGQIRTHAAERLSNTYVITFDAEMDPAAVAGKYAALPGVIYAQPDHICRVRRTDPDDTYWLTTGAWGQSYRDQWDMEIMACPSAWDIQTGSASVIVAVSDTGIDYTHTDIAANIWVNSGETAGNGLDDDGNGYIDDEYGYDFVNEDANPMDGHGHGTHVAGTIGAVGNNATGIAGVNWTCTLMAIKGLSDEGIGYESDLAHGIEYATDNGAKVINMSWGGLGFMQAIHDALVYAHDSGVVLCVAAGNDGMDTGGSSEYDWEDISYPDTDNYVMSVAASDETDVDCLFSNWGIRVAVAAPGGSNDYYNYSIYSPEYNILAPRSQFFDEDTGLVVDTNYLRLAGTSMACPHVAGLAALVIAQNPTWTSEQIRQAIQMQADDIVRDGFDTYTGFGRINAYNSVISAEPMIAFISSPQSSALKMGNFTITGTADGPDLSEWILDYGAEYEPDTWTTIASGTTEVVDGDLATAELPGGRYTLRLRTTGAGDVLDAEYRLQINAVDPPTLPTPTFDPDGSTFAMPVDVAISCEEEEATIHYTTDGNDPTESDPTVESGASIVIDHDLTLKAKAWKEGWKASEVKSAAYTFRDPVIIRINQNASGTVSDGTSWPTAYKTVQEGLDAIAEVATAGDEVWVAAGTYVENITLPAYVALYGGFAGTETARSQRNYSANLTILDGNQAGTVVTVAPDSSEYTRIDGFTIRNGNSSLDGGGIACRYGSSPTIANNVISGNTSRNEGGGISCHDNCAPIIANNVIAGNSAGHGGGIGCAYSSSASISNNIISGNSAVQAGGGISCNYDSNAAISGNMIAENSAYQGAGISCYSSIPTIAGNRITGNTSPSSFGGGIYLWSSSATVSNNVIAGNQASKGGGISLYLSAPPVRNNTIVGNTATQGGGMYIRGYSSTPTLSNNIIAFGSSGIYMYSGSPTLTKNCVYGNTGYGYSGLSAGSYDISSDPKLVNRSGGDYHLQTSSPCVDAGNSDAVEDGDVDMDGEERIYGSEVDIGADEWMPSLPGTPTIVSLTSYPETVSQANWAAYVCTYSDGNGWANLSRVRLLVNGSVSASGAAYFIYDQNTNKLYGVSNAGAVIPAGGVTPGTGYVIETENAYLDCQNTIVSGSGNDLAVVWRVKYKPNMANKTHNLYMFASDDGGLSSGWAKKGAATVQYTNAGPGAVSISPSSGSVAADTWSTMSAQYSDPNGRTNLYRVRLLVNTSVSANGAAYFIYDANANKLYGISNAGAYVGGYAPGSTNVIETENAYLDCQSTTIEPASLGAVSYTLGTNTLKVNFRVKLKTGMAGKTHNTYLLAGDDLAAVSGWAKRGTITVTRL